MTRRTAGNATWRRFDALKASLVAVWSGKRAGEAPMIGAVVCGIGWYRARRLGRLGITAFTEAVTVE